MAKFSISAAQVEDLWGWTSSHPWHPCLLASVNADNDYAFANASLTGSGIVRRRNNLAQRNLSVIDAVPGATYAFPFVVGNLGNLERTVEIKIDRRYLPREIKPLLALDEDIRVFPKITELNQLERIPEISPRIDNSFIFLDRARLATPMAGSGGVIMLERGSALSLTPSRRFERVNVIGGEVLLRDTKRFVELSELSPVIRLDKEPRQLYQVELQTKIPNNAERGQRYKVSIAQRDSRGETVGGATVIYQIR
jgi:hypothetical protein